jgi:hypothetical protein
MIRRRRPNLVNRNKVRLVIAAKNREIMIIMLVSVEARHGKQVVFDQEQQVAGYYQTFGVTAFDENELKSLIVNYLNSDLESSLVDIVEIWTPDLIGNDREIKELVGDMNKPGIWYISGRAWFPSDAN